MPLVPRVPGLHQSHLPGLGYHERLGGHILYTYFQSFLISKKRPSNSGDFVSIDQILIDKVHTLDNY